MDRYLKKVFDFCQEYDMLPKSGNVIVCVSGGTDSMCLLNLLNELSEKVGFSLHAAHFNHMLRGSESDGDEAFVIEECGKLGIPLSVGSGDVSGEAARTGRGIEETGRDMRYDFFHRLSIELDGAKIATAHNADDQLETVLLRLVRGTGLRGLCGIPPVRGKIIRPLLCLTRDEIEQYNTGRSIAHREDSTNSDDTYSRNNIRLHVLPVLRKLNPSVSTACVETCGLLRKDESFLQSLADSFIGENYLDGSLPAEKLCSLPFPVSSRVIRTLCGSGIDSGHVKSVLILAASDDPSASLSLPGMILRREYEKLVFSQLPKVSGIPESQLIPGSVLKIPEAGCLISCYEDIAPCGIYKSFTTFLFKFSAICGNITVRSRMTGDSIRLSENSGSKSLKRLFIDRKIPALKRSLVPVICDGRGPIAVPGIGCDIRVRPSPGDRVLKVTVEEIKDIC